MKVPDARILVIDDDPQVVDLVVTCLLEEGYKAVGTLTGEDGLVDFLRVRPDLVLLDIARYPA